MKEIPDKITREYIKKNPDKIFLFGDNLQKRGLRGQSAEMRGEPNAIGIPTKKRPSMNENAFFSDFEYEQNKYFIDEALKQIPKGKEIIIPKMGLGTGLAQLDKRAPKTFKYLQYRLSQLKKNWGRQSCRRVITELDTLPKIKRKIEKNDATFKDKL
jgi:hypothetical protein